MSNILVIIPTYNEKENIEDIIHAVFALDNSIHILIVDDNSPDGTAVIVKEIQKNHNCLHLIEREGKLGLGTAYIAGFKFGIEQGYDYILEMDADFSHNPKDVPRLIEACKNGGSDITVGSRYVNTGGVKDWDWFRHFLSKGASYYVKLLTGLPVQDPTAGFVCYRIEVLKTLDLDRIEFVGYAFQIEMKYAAWGLGYKIEEVPIIFEDRKKGTSKMNLSIVREAIVGVLRMRNKYKKDKLYYKKQYSNK